jgi:mannose-6-phosphate isomerase-like protein (cupin superfamily)
MAETFADDLMRFSREFVAGVQIGDILWKVVVQGGEVTLTQAKEIRADFTCVMDEKTFKNIAQGKWTALTAAASGREGEPAPLDVRLGEGKRFDQCKTEILFFLSHFFNYSCPEVTYWRPECSRVVHGARAIPLFYAPGFRSAWYQVRRGERVNRRGEKDPFPQGIVIIRGRGFVQIDNVKMEVSLGTALYIPPGSGHTVWTEADEPLEFIWTAWGPEA